MKFSGILGLAFALASIDAAAVSPSPFVGTWYGVGNQYVMEMSISDRRDLPFCNPASGTLTQAGVADDPQGVSVGGHYCVFNGGFRLSGRRKIDDRMIWVQFRGLVFEGPKRHLFMLGRLKRMTTNSSKFEYVLLAKGIPI